MRLWPFGVMQHVWRGKGTDGAFELQRRLHVLFHFLNFSLKRRVMYEPPGVWPILPPGTDPDVIMCYPNSTMAPSIQLETIFICLGSGTKSLHFLMEAQDSEP